MRTKSAFLPVLSLECRFNPFVQVALDGEGLVFNFVRYVLPDGLVTGPGRPDGLVYNLVPVAESRDDADVAR
jgi:hypothetical protein